MEFILDNKKKIFIGGILLFIAFLVITYLLQDKSNDNPIEMVDTTTKTTEKIDRNFYVDVKGAVKDPGVYLVKDGERVIDVIDKAGGLTRSADTGNINLSKRLTSEMVVYVYTKKEIKEGSIKSECNTECNCETIEINNCVDKGASQSNNLVNINTATLDELMSLSGVGESKAKAIISYREENGNFKSIEEIKNVSGIGDALFDKIRGEITV